MEVRAVEVGQDGFTINTWRCTYVPIRWNTLHGKLIQVSEQDYPTGTSMYLLTMYKRSNVRIDGIHSLPI